MFKIETNYDRKFIRETIQALINELPENEKLVISLMFGINEEEHTVDEISGYLDVSTQRVYQIKDSAFSRLVKKTYAKKLKRQIVDYV